ncbi:MAG: hypothetical protein H0W72_00790 [Planctomycetes bacterium]|nr:hypothetical protein [Planctomycetota bacterium]
MDTYRRPTARDGAILILVAGITGLLTSLAVAFIMRMRMDAEEVTEAMRESQARIMLLAACNYVQEASRLGYDDNPATTTHQEAYGWLDVVDGSIGPKWRDGTGASGLCYSTALVEDSDGNGSADRPAWPAQGSVVRCPMHVLERPPYAISPTTRYNPISTDSTSADFGLPYLRYPDPRPAVDNGWSNWTNLSDAVNVNPTVIPAGSSTTRWEQYSRGDIRPRPSSTNLSWFRIFREEGADNAASFVVTCGAGATQGFRDWNEVVGAGAQARFYSDQTAFEDALSAETRLWYRIEWSAAVMSSDFHLTDHELVWANPVRETNAQWPLNATDAYIKATDNSSRHDMRSTLHAKNLAGTIRWVQRLPGPPTPPSPEVGKW